MEDRGTSAANAGAVAVGAFVAEGVTEAADKYGTSASNAVAVGVSVAERVTGAVDTAGASAVGTTTSGAGSITLESAEGLTSGDVAAEAVEGSRAGSTMGAGRAGAVAHATAKKAEAVRSATIDRCIHGP